jgi:hypothetical protein
MNQKEVRIINDSTKKEFVVPPGGSLGLLALGNIGVRAWKKEIKVWEETQNKDIEKK